MLALTEAAQRRSLVNCSRSEAAAMTPPRDLAELDWASLDVLGWRDTKAELRGYLVHDRGVDGVVGLALRAADTKMSSRRGAMCTLCRTVQPADQISLFTARRVGEAGRNGNTVGTYVCADLGCAARARTEIPPWLRERDPAEVADERAAELRQRVETFLDAVLR